MSLPRCLKVSSLMMRSWLLLRSSLSSQRVRENMEEESEVRRREAEHI